ncbi:hypothetical protein HMPREF9591_01240 [Cutibacterium acnes HL086PA1]|nr:hypothetical protein HMPREF9575_00080 [Cutibacterium acnes HL110PA1]EFS76881.1 hypothetical protein HMPREF9591_01240 [Cutibacterium acnes HL086PA1]
MSAPKSFTLADEVFPSFLALSTDATHEGSQRVVVPLMIPSW